MGEVMTHFVVEKTNSKYKNVMRGQLGFRRSYIAGQVLMLHECSTCTLNYICEKLQFWGRSSRQLHNSAWFRTLGVGIIIIFNKQLRSNLGLGIRLLGPHEGHIGLKHRLLSASASYSSTTVHPPTLNDWPA